MIRIGKYGLEPDAHCWRLGVVAETTDDAGNTVEVLRQCKYPTDLASAMAVLLELRIRDIDPTELREVRDEIRRFRAELSELFTIKVEAA